MTIDPLIIGPMIVAIVSLQAWLLSEVVTLKTQVAVLAATCKLCIQNKNK